MKIEKVNNHFFNQILQVQQQVLLPAVLQQFVPIGCKAVGVATLASGVGSSVGNAVYQLWNHNVK